MIRLIYIFLIVNLNFLHTNPNSFVTETKKTFVDINEKKDYNNLYLNTKDMKISNIDHDLWSYLPIIINICIDIGLIIGGQLLFTDIKHKIYLYIFYFIILIHFCLSIVIIFQYYKIFLNGLDNLLLLINNNVFIKKIKELMSMVDIKEKIIKDNIKNKKKLIKKLNNFKNILNKKIREINEYKNLKKSEQPEFYKIKLTNNNKYKDNINDFSYYNNLLIDNNINNFNKNSIEWLKINNGDQLKILNILLMYDIVKNNYQYKIIKLDRNNEELVIKEIIDKGYIESSLNQWTQQDGLFLKIIETNTTEINESLIFISPLNVITIYQLKNYKK